MLEELEQQVQKQQLEWKVRSPAEEYRGLGGSLNEQSFDKAMGLLSELRTGSLPVRESPLTQEAENMAKFSNVPVTQEQKYLYAALREMTKKTDGMLASSSDTLGNAPWSLSDQPLMAEVLLLTGETAKYDDFKNAYPNIFLETE